MGTKISLQILLLVGAAFAKSIPNNEAEKPTIAKSVPNEGRSSGMSLYSQSSNAKVVTGQNLRSKVTYYTPKPSRVGQSQEERLPAKGEVQERFNPRPYFDYVSVHSHGGEESTKDTSKPAVVYGAPFDSFPVFNGGGDSKPSEVDAKPSEFNPPDSTANSSPSDAGPPNSQSGYDSPFDSYNPPKDDFPNSQDGPVYPPAASKPQPPPPPAQPAKPAQDSKASYPGFPYAPAELDHPPKDYMPEGPGKDVILDYNPKEVDSYMPMEQAKPEMEDTGPPPKPTNYHDYSSYSDAGPRIVATVKPPGSYQDYPVDSYHYHDLKHEHAVDTPPAPAPASYAKIPDYIDHEPKEHGYHYPEFAHIEHPVYHEVTTTTTEAPEDERVNKGHYSYYYLGRKLWYIPLYFSAYFIIYIAILILKSIARHKVNFIHDLHDLGKGRSARNMKIDDLTANVTSAIENAQNKYMM